MIDPLNETLLSFRDLCSKLPGRNGKRLNIATVYRWCQKGRRGVRLDSVLVGGTRYTSEWAVRQFFKTVSSVEYPPQFCTSTKQRQKSIDKARRELEGEGL